VIVGAVASFQMRTNNISKFASRLLISANFRQSPKQVLDLIKTTSHQVFFSDFRISISPYFKFGTTSVHICYQFICVYDLKGIIIMTAK